MVKKVMYRGTGRRKSSVARVMLSPGTGKFVINKRQFEDYISSAATRLDVMQPLELTSNQSTFDITVNVNGGGITGQAGAIRHGITRALLEVNADYIVHKDRNGQYPRESYTLGFKCRIGNKEYGYSFR